MKSLLAGLVLAAFAWMPAAHAMNAAELASCRENTPQQVRTLRGLFTVRIACDRVLFEIPKPMLNRDMHLRLDTGSIA